MIKIQIIIFNTESCKDGFRQIDIVNDVTIRMLSPISGGLAGSVATSALENFQGKSTLTDANLVVYMVFTGNHLFPAVILTAT